MKTNLKAVSQKEPLYNITDRLHRAIGVLTFMSNATGRMLDDDEGIPHSEDNSIGADIVFQWLIKEMQDIADCSQKEA